MKQNIQDKKGFTIIEVVLVLAIAGLIFLMVFIALPALQRNQRDTQRKNDIGRVQTAVNSYQSNNSGKLPTFNDAFATKYLTVNGDSFLDPSGVNTVETARTFYQFVDPSPAALPTFSPIEQNKIYIDTGNICDGEALKTAGSRKVAIRIVLEGGGNACVSN